MKTMAPPPFLCHRGPNNDPLLPCLNETPMTTKMMMITKTRNKTQPTMPAAVVSSVYFT